MSKSLINLRIKHKKRYLRERDFEDNLSVLLFLEKEMAGSFCSSCPGKKKKIQMGALCVQSEKNSCEAS